jgi:hypothetical protein
VFVRAPDPSGLTRTAALADDLTGRPHSDGLPSVKFSDGVSVLPASASQGKVGLSLNAGSRAAEELGFSGSRSMNPSREGPQKPSLTGQPPGPTIVSGAPRLAAHGKAGKTLGALFKRAAKLAGK